VAGVVVAFAVGYPAGQGNTLVIVTLTFAAVALALRRWRVPAIALFVLAVLLSFHPTALHDHGRTTDVAALRLSTVGEPVHRFALEAAHLDVTLPDGRTVAALGFNGRVPGPEIRVKQGEIVEVTLRNKDVEDGVTLHWHGYPVPNGDDGVAGLTQDAVMPGAEYVYRFRATKAGTYWYHTHQISHRGVKLGLYGAFVVEAEGAQGIDVTVPIHTLSGAMLPIPGLPASGPVRLRLINTDDVSHRIAVQGTPWQLSAVDGTDLSGPTPVLDKALTLPAGGRADLTFDAPATLEVDHASLETLDPLDYGTPAGPAPSRFDRSYTVVLDRQLRLLNWLPQYAYTINGAVWPATPTLLVRQGEWVRLTIVNRDKEVHPMHPHGHQVLVLSRNGVVPRGGPVWTDSFLLAPGETWEVALRADNPGLWMFHCHNLPHAVKGMMLHLAYEGVYTGYQLGGDNHPE
jgi:FtsP/CotA-like multicopper oxidase with cupredoxin domain